MKLPTLLSTINQTIGMEKSFVVANNVRYGESCLCYKVDCDISGNSLRHGMPINLTYYLCVCYFLRILQYPVKYHLQYIQNCLTVSYMPTIFRIEYYLEMDFLNP